LTPAAPASFEVVAFDLDDTLYDEGAYFAAAFEAVGDALARSPGVAREDVLRRLASILRAKGRHHHRLFNDLLGELGLDEGTYLAALLDLFRGVRPRLSLFPGAAELLRDLGKRYRLGLITSGMRAVQENKLRLLGIADVFERVVFSSTLPENKPGRLPFRRLLEAMGVPAARAVYVGDNPLFDFKGANELGMLTVRVRNPAFDGLALPAGHDARMRVEAVADLRSLFLTEEGIHVGFKR